MTCLVINKKMVSTDVCSNKIKIPVKQGTRGKAEKSLVKFPILCQVCSQCARCLNILCFCAFSNRFGRKPVIFLTFFLQGSTALIQAASVSWLMFCVLNFLRGISHNYAVSLILGEYIPCTLIIIQKHVFLHLPSYPSCIWSCLGTEMLRKSARVAYSLVGHSLGYGVGYALLPLLAYFIRSWRMLMVASAIPSLLFIPTWWWVVVFVTFYCLFCA